MNWDDLVAIHAALPEPAPIFYRLYYDSTGTPLFYSMEDLPGTYIDIDQAAYARNSRNVRVRDGKSVEVTWQTSIKIVPGDSGYACDPSDVAIVVADDQPNIKWSKKTYETS